MTRKVEFQYAATDSAFQRVSKRVESSFGRLQKAGLNFNNVLKLGAGTFALAQIGRGAGALASSLSAAFAEQEDAVIGLQASLNATGKSGGDAFRILSEEASRLQRITRAGDEAILKASASLSTLVPSLDVAGLKNGQTALVALADTFFEGNLDTAALQLGKTLGSTTNALARYGIQIENSAAPASEKLAEILGDGKLQAAFAGATARAQTYGGSLVQLGNAQGDLRESLAGVVVESLNLTSINQRLTDRILKITSSIENNRAQWVGWGRVIASTGVVIYSTIETTARIAFNLVQVLGRVGIALGSLANRDFAGVRQAVRGIRGDFGDMGDQLEKDNRRWIQLANNIGIASQGLATTGSAAQEAAAGITAVAGAIATTTDDASAQKLDQAIAAVSERYKVWGREIDVVAEKSKILRAEIDRQLGGGASATDVQPLIDRLSRVRGEWELSGEGAANFAAELRSIGVAGLAVFNDLDIVTKRMARIATVGASAGTALRQGLLGAADDFGRSFIVTLDRVELRVGDFVNSILARLANAFATSAFLKLIGLALGGPTASFGSILLGQLGIGQQLTRAAVSPAAASQSSRIVVDLSNVPRPLTTREAARDQEIIELVVGAMNNGLANGHRLGRR